MFKKIGLPRSIFCTGVFALSLGLGITVSTARAQSTISTGSISGTVTDQSGASVADAKVTITNKDTGQSMGVVTNSSGTYSSGGMIPGNYAVRVEAKGFKTEVLTMTVQVGVSASGNVKLEIGSATTVVEVAGE